MRTHTNDFKNDIKELGRELDSIITYTSGADTITLGVEDLNNVTPKVESNLLKSVMKEIDIDSNIDIPLNTELNYKFGVKTRSGKNLFDKTTPISVMYIATNVQRTGSKTFLPAGTYTVSGGNSNIYTKTLVGSTYGEYHSIPATLTLPSDGYILLYAVQGSMFTDAVLNSLQIEQGTRATSYEAFGMYDYIDYGNYIVYSSEYSADNNAYVIKAYDKMLYSMKEYTTLQSAEFPLTIRDYITAICQDIGLTFANSSDTFANYDKIIKEDVYANINYTYRDILDDLSEVTASNICIDKDDELEIRHIKSEKNLLCFGTLPSAVGLTIVKVNNSAIGINGTTSSQITLNIPFVNAKALTGKQHTFSISIKSGVSDKTITASVGNSTQFQNLSIPGNRTSTSENGKTYTGITLTIPQNTQCTNLILQFQIEEGNKTSFEPHYNNYDIIDEEYLKDVNVSFGEIYGPVNTIVLKRSEDSDGVYKSTSDLITDDEKNAITIKDNQIMNGDDRSDYLNDILSQLKDLQYCLNDYISTGILYYEVCDRYKVKIDNTYYSCVLFNDEANITQGLVESVYTPKPDITENEYKYMTTDEKLDRSTKLIVDKANHRIDVQAQELEIITTNIDRETGDINAVTTKEKHFTFNDEGLTISAGDNDFKSVSDETGTYYYDGTTEVGEYTKDGSKQKDLSLFGIYKYGMDEIDDTPMFVAQLYTNNGKEGFGHFYNGGDI